MKHLLAAATVAALLAATPASAQMAFGVATPGDDGQGFGTDADGTFRGSVTIYSTIDPALPAAATIGPVSLGSAPASFAGDVVATAASSGASNAVVGAPANATGVPEPATWAMMLVGFGAVGTALRTRRKATLRFT